MGQYQQKMNRFNHKLEKIFELNTEVNFFLRETINRTERLEEILKRISKTARFNRQGQIIVTCFSGEQYEIQNYIELILNEEK